MLYGLFGLLLNLTPLQQHGVIPIILGGGPGDFGIKYKKREQIKIQIKGGI